MNPLTLTRKVISTAASLGAGKIVGSIVASTTPQNNLYQKVTVRTGAFVMGYMLGDAIDHYLEKKQVEIETWWHENITTKTDPK